PALPPIPPPNPCKLVGEGRASGLAFPAEVKAFWCYMYVMQIRFATIFLVDKIFIYNYKF
ncbi:MAG: hypothetical protein LAN71_18030, partial [Acidobacteriia bacterium]|nr:hypothetical protein [Terriglobia bacterium]